MTEEAASKQEIGLLRGSKILGASIYAFLFLLLVRYGFERALMLRYDRLMREHQLNRAIHLLDHPTTLVTLITLAGLAIVICICRFGPLRMTIGDMGLKQTTPRWRGIVWGSVAGLLAFGAAIPLLRLDRYDDLTSQIINGFYHPRIAFYVILFIIALPVSCELVFRGIIFKSFSESSTVVPAVLLTAIMFALVWPVTNYMIGFILGIVTAILYRAFRSVFPTIVANVVFTFASFSFLVWERLNSGILF